MGQTVPFESPRRPSGKPSGSRSIPWIRALRGAGAFCGAFSFLYLVLASGLSRQTEASWAVPFGLLPIAFLLGVGAFGQELAKVGSPRRRDALFGVAAAIASFAVLRISGAF